MMLEIFAAGASAVVLFGLIICAALRVVEYYKDMKQKTLKRQISSRHEWELRQ
jgi:hypothetical protein